MQHFKKPWMRWYLGGKEEVPLNHEWENYRLGCGDVPIGNTWFDWRHGVTRLFQWKGPSGAIMHWYQVDFTIQRNLPTKNKCVSMHSLKKSIWQVFMEGARKWMVEEPHLNWRIDLESQRESLKGPKNDGEWWLSFGHWSLWDVLFFPEGITEM